MLYIAFYSSLMYQKQLKDCKSRTAGDMIIHCSKWTAVSEMVNGNYFSRLLTIGKLFWGFFPFQQDCQSEYPRSTERKIIIVVAILGRLEWLEVRHFWKYNCLSHLLDNQISGAKIIWVFNQKTSSSESVKMECFNMFLKYFFHVFQSLLF